MFVLLPEYLASRENTSTHEIPNKEILFLSYKRYTIVVYFDQRAHACTCVCMVENDLKHLKMNKKVPFSSSA